MSALGTRTRHGARRQQGAALFFALIMLGLMTLLAISAFNISSVNLKIVSNVQARQEATAAADQGAQIVIGTKTFALSPSPYTTSLDVDTNNDTAPDYTTAVVASCLTYRAYPAPAQILDPEDKCNGSRTLGTAFCNQAQWDVQSHAVPATGGAYRGNVGTDVTVHQGVSMVMSVDASAAACP
jgi:Tfp pilus assembly major pilin PilA